MCQLDVNTSMVIKFHLIFNVQDITLTQVKKNTEIPTLPRYKNCPGSAFWSKFPSNPMPSHPKATTCIRLDRLKYWRDISQDKLSIEHRVKVDKVIQDLEFGADAQECKSLLTLFHTIWGIPLCDVTMTSYFWETPPYLRDDVILTS